MRYVACLGLAAVAFTLAACQETVPTVDPVTDDAARCSAAGFTAGTAEMAQCMQTASRERRADQDRQAVQDAWQQQIDREDAAKRDADWQKSNDDFEAGNAQRRAEAAAVMDGSGDIFGNSIDPGPLPSAVAIPGMECSGVGDEAACDALSEY